MSKSTATKEIQPVSSGDEVFATGRLIRDGETVRLDAVGRVFFVSVAGFITTLRITGRGETDDTVIGSPAATVHHRRR